MSSIYLIISQNVFEYNWDIFVNSMKNCNWDKFANGTRENCN